MDDDGRYNYWNQPSGYDAGQNDPYGDKYDYDPEEEKGDLDRSVRELEEQVMVELDSQMPTFMNEDVSSTH